MVLPTEPAELKEFAATTTRTLLTNMLEQIPSDGPNARLLLDAAQQSDLFQVTQRIVLNALEAMERQQSARLTTIARALRNYRLAIFIVGVAVGYAIARLS